jgi:hypothetical protein
MYVEIDKIIVMVPFISRWIYIHIDSFISIVYNELFIFINIVHWWYRK